MVRPALCAILLLILCACAPRYLPASAVRPPAASDPLRPPGSPDVVIFGVSGRCVWPCQQAPADNWDYLTKRGTLKAIAEAFQARGYRTEVHGYSDNLPREHTSSLAQGPQYGFLQLQDDFERVRRELVLGRRNPALLVLVGHSHGVTWTHQLARLYPDTPITLMVDLDGICLLWESDHAPDFAAYREAHPEVRWPFDFPHGCEVIRLGRRAYRPKDLVWDNVRYNLEVQSKVLWWGMHGGGHRPSMPTNFLFEVTPNRRPDGSTQGIQTFADPFDDHGSLTHPGSAGLSWVLARIAELPLEVPPAPDPSDGR